MGKTGFGVPINMAKKAIIRDMLDKYSKSKAYRATMEDYRRLLRVYSYPVSVPATKGAQAHKRATSPALRQAN